MDLFEYQARDIFEEHGVPVLQGTVATSPAEAREAAEQIGGPVVVKAQVKIGGRGKAGGIRVAETPDAAHAAADAILGLDIRGHRAEKVMVVECVDIEEEYYFSILLDRAARTFLAMFSVEGGVDIEKLAEERPDAITRVEVDPLGELDAEALVAALPEDVRPAVIPVLHQLLDVYRAEDATLVEVNPLVLTVDGRVIALDGKITLDDNAAFRHDNRAELADAAGHLDPVEKRAREHGLKYVTLDGSVGIIGNGAGLVMSTLDVVSGAGEKHGGQKPANFLDIGGGASPETMTAALEIVLSDDDVRSVFVNVFGGITSCDAVATGIVEALTRLDDASRPIVVRLDGNSVDEGRAILEDFDHPLVTVVADMEEAGDKVTELAAMTPSVA
ncbi:succinyl-CoA synthetase (ADP-forming) beta subunit [Corynebacterium pollutisoli]|uniref:Succinate--CoA ligase [ADP-forming] subunit beta n=1 Tax=Corynebacterium pollutisoli TaxID=1610489 RepID=A0A1X7ICB2_9CORY|nr:ADP-forming succinate--CoA ligase subunit beta [Corynebacterium pollutisoli]SMG12082.1 succinyl-CoA synthetase (ADP-forming) beta subunit [Corynebacterium pollutisoli]